MRQTGADLKEYDDPGGRVVRDRFNSGRRGLYRFIAMFGLDSLVNDC